MESSLGDKCFVLINLSCQLLLLLLLKVSKTHLLRLAASQPANQPVIHHFNYNNNSLFKCCCCCCYFDYKISASVADWLTSSGTPFVLFSALQTISSCFLQHSNGSFLHTLHYSLSLGGWIDGWSCLDVQKLSPSLTVNWWTGWFSIEDTFIVKVVYKTTLIVFYILVLII